MAAAELFTFAVRFKISDTRDSGVSEVLISYLSRINAQ